MKRYKKNIIYLLLIGVCMGICGCGNSGDPREEYENALAQIEVADINNNEYLSSISVDTDFNNKEDNSYFDTVDIHINLIDNFEELKIEDKCAALYKIENSLNDIIENLRYRNGL